MTFDETIDKRPAVPPVAADGDDSHGGHVHQHPHRSGSAATTGRPAVRRARGRVFLASALERFAFALIIVGALWLAVVWAML